MQFSAGRMASRLSSFHLWLLLPLHPLSHWKMEKQTKWRYMCLWPFGSFDILLKSSAHNPLVSTNHTAHLCVSGGEALKHSLWLVRRGTNLWWSARYACHTRWKTQFPSGDYMYLAFLPSSLTPHLFSQGFYSQSLMISPSAFPHLFSQAGTLAKHFSSPWKSSFIWDIYTLTCSLTLVLFTFSGVLRTQSVLSPPTPPWAAFLILFYPLTHLCRGRPSG